MSKSINYDRMMMDSLCAELRREVMNTNVVIDEAPDSAYEGCAKRYSRDMRHAIVERIGAFFEEYAARPDSAATPSAPAPPDLPDDKGVWFVSAVSGLRYRERGAAGDVSAVIVDGERFGVTGASEERSVR